jgi:hypothetical protein
MTSKLKHRGREEGHQIMSAVPPPCLPDEILDWDFFAGSEPERPSGTISVTLEYVGRTAAPATKPTVQLNGGNQ